MANNQTFSNQDAVSPDELRTLVHHQTTSYMGKPRTSPSMSSQSRHAVTEQTRFTLLAEGNANAVFSTDIQAETPKVLRVPKEADWTSPSISTMKYYETRIKPLFLEDMLVDISLVELNSTIVDQLNRLLARAELDGTRPSKRRAVYIAPFESHGILATDMGVHSKQESMIEFKPKWLIQSPSAPKDSIRCRTCAMREMRASDQRRKTGLLPKSVTLEEEPTEFCPLDLLSHNVETLRSIARIAGASEDKVDAFANVLDYNSTIRRLRKVQMSKNNVGLQNFLDKDDVSVAMTVRDCSLFVKLEEVSGQVKVQSVLADLDIKICSDKNFDKWAAMESRLIKEGWYQGTEQDEHSNKRPCNLKAGSEGFYDDSE